MIAGFSIVAAATRNVKTAQSRVIPCSSQETSSQGYRTLMNCVGRPRHHPSGEEKRGDIRGLAGEVSASRFHNGRWPSDADVDPTPLAPAGGLDGEHVLLAQFVDETRRRDCGLDERAGE